MWISPEEYANRYRISLPSLYPALRAGRVPGSKRVGGGRAWRIWDDGPTPHSQFNNEQQFRSHTARHSA